MTNNITEQGKRQICCQYEEEVISDNGLYTIKQKLS